MSTTGSSSVSPSHIGSPKKGVVKRSRMNVSKSSIKYKPTQIQTSQWLLDERYSSAVYITQGAYGEVIRATDTLSNHSVVIKKIEILQDDNSADWENSIRILREVHFLSTITHPYICSLVDLFPCHPGNKFDHMFIVTPFYNFGSLDTYNVQTVKEAGEIFTQVAIALQFIHSHGVLHRDLKRDNVFVSRDGQKLKVVLGDFGLSRESRRSMTHEVVTRPYRAPCLILHEMSYGPEVDVFAAGCVLFEMLAIKGSSTIIHDKLLGGSVQLQAQLALSPVTSFDKKLLQLAASLRIDLNRCLEKSKSGLPSENAKKHWGNLEDFFRRDHSLDLLVHATALINRLICFNPSQRCTIAEALAHPFLTVADVESLSRARGEFRSSRETFAEDIELLPTNEVRALEVKKQLWKLIRSIRGSQLPDDLESSYPRERLGPVELGEAPVIETSPIAKRTRSQIKL